MSLVLEKLEESFAPEIVATHSDFGDDTAVVRRERIVEILGFLRDDPGLRFDFAMFLTGVDHYPETPRFEVVYHLYSLEKKHRVRIRAQVPEEDPSIDSAAAVWPTLNWYEREAFDMYGIVFQGHPNLKRILMYEGFEGHPLRKDYPKDGRQPTIGPMEEGGIGDPTRK